MNYLNQPPESAQKRSVLIVDSSEENCEVLQTALLRRGVQAFTAKHTTEGANLARRHRPDLIILDLEADNNSQNASYPPFWAFGECKNVPLILLGTLRRNIPRTAHSEFVAKPYHYGPLIRRIEEMLAVASQDVALQP
jgi:DNA-binding NtrC family response regulator